MNTPSTVTTTLSRARLIACDMCQTPTRNLCSTRIRSVMYLRHMPFRMPNTVFGSRAWSWEDLESRAMKVGFVPQYQKRVLGGSFDLVSPHSIALAFISQKWRTTAAATTTTTTTATTTTTTTPATTAAAAATAPTTASSTSTSSTTKGTSTVQVPPVLALALVLVLCTSATASAGPVPAPVLVLVTSTLYWCQ